MTTAGSQNTQSSLPIAVPGTINGISSGGSAPATSVAQSNELGLPVGYGQGAVPSRTNPNFPCPVGPLADIPPVPDGFGANSPFPINYYGGPPAWPSAQGYGQPGFFVGYPVGFTDFGATPVAGTYSLDVAYATNQSSTTYGRFDASARLKSVQPLPALTITSADVESDGSGLVVLTVPPGILETIVFVRSYDCTPPQNHFDNYAVITHSVGRQSFYFGPNLGPPSAAGQPTNTFCNSPTNTGIVAAAYAVGFDYPAYESSYPFNVTQAPPITNGDGHTGQADVTTSVPLAFSSGS